MTRSLIAGGGFVLALVLALAAGQRAMEKGDVPPATAAPAALPPSVPPVPVGTTRGFLYGRVTTIDGAAYEGRLRWGRDQEAFWGDYFNGAKEENPWVAHVPSDRRPTERRALEFLGLKFGNLETPVDLGRLFMVRFGDIARIEARGRRVLVTLKSGAVFELDRFEAGDLDDGLRVWDARRGVVDLDTLRIRAIEFLPTPALADVPDRLHGTVHTPEGTFTGFVQWDRQECVGTDVLDGRTAEGDLSLRFDTIRSIARLERGGSRVTQLDGSDVELSGTNDVDADNRGLYVDDPRYGRVLIAWGAFERVNFQPAGSGPSYEEYLPGRPLTGSVTTRGGDRLAGRLVYDLDETETTETLDGSSRGVNYTIPFGMLDSIALQPDSPEVTVTLLSGEELSLERAGDLGERNAGILVFAEGGESPGYVPWADVERVDFDRAQPDRAP